MFEILLACHVMQIDAINRPVSSKDMEDAYYAAGPDMAIFGRIARVALVCVLLALPIAALAYTAAI